MTRAELVAEAKKLGVTYLPHKSIAQLTAEIAHIKKGGAPYKGFPPKVVNAPAPAPTPAPKAKSPAPAPKAESPKVPTMDDVKQMICYVLNKIKPELEKHSTSGGYNPLIGGPHKGVLRLGCTIEKKHVPPTLKKPYEVHQDPWGVYWDMPSRGPKAWGDFTIYFDPGGHGRFLFQSHNIEKNTPTVATIIKEACEATMAKKDIEKIKINS